MTEIIRSSQFVGQADVGKIKDVSVTRKESTISPEQRQFAERYHAEYSKAQATERAANKHARDRLKGLSAPELRKIGAKQLLWGWGLQFINLAGEFIGGFGGGLGTWATVAALGGSTLLATASGIAVGAIGAVGGAVAGAELVKSIYEKIARKWDKSLPAIDHNERVLGDVFAVIAGWNAPMIAGVKNIFEGYNNMKRIQ